MLHSRETHSKMSHHRLIGWAVKLMGHMLMQEALPSWKVFPNSDWTNLQVVEIKAGRHVSWGDTFDLACGFVHMVHHRVWQASNRHQGQEFWIILPGGELQIINQSQGPHQTQELIMLAILNVEEIMDFATRIAKRASNAIKWLVQGQIPHSCSCPLEQFASPAAHARMVW